MIALYMPVWVPVARWPFSALRCSALWGLPRPPRTEGRHQPQTGHKSVPDDMQMGHADWTDARGTNSRYEEGSEARAREVESIWGVFAYKPRKGRSKVFTLDGRRTRHLWLDDLPSPPSFQRSLLARCHQTNTTTNSTRDTIGSGGCVVWEELGHNICGKVAFPHVCSVLTILLKVSCIDTSHRTRQLSLQSRLWETLLAVLRDLVVCHRRCPLKPNSALLWLVWRCGLRVESACPDTTFDLIWFFFPSP